MLIESNTNFEEQIVLLINFFGLFLFSSSKYKKLPDQQKLPENNYFLAQQKKII